MKNLIQALLQALTRAKIGTFAAVANARESIRVLLIQTAALVFHVEAPHFKFEFECYGPDGKLKWRDGFRNTVLTAGKNDLLTNYFKGSAYTAAFFVGLVDNASFSAISAADTMASHAGWVEAVPYSNSTRPALTLGTPSAGSVDNSASKASYTINATATINGAFVATNSTKSGTSGVGYSAGSFGATRSVASGDTLNVQVTLTV